MPDFPQQDSRHATHEKRCGHAERTSAAMGWHGWLADMAAALALLTVLPMPSRWQSGAGWPRALRMLPLAGAFIGLAQGLLLVLLLWLLPSLPLAAVLLALLGGIILTGALHEDGLADFADALGGRTQERRLEIMRDARIGSFGVLALVFALSLQAVALLALTGKGATAALAALVLAHAASRLAAVWLLHSLPHARADGMSVSTGRPDDAAMALAGLTVAALMMGLWPWLAAAMPAVFILAMLAAIGMRRLCTRLLGGQTGDAAGAMEVVVRTTVLLVLAGLGT